MKDMKAEARDQILRKKFAESYGTVDVTKWLYLPLR
jgi:hypothetical protein